MNSPENQFFIYLPDAIFAKEKKQNSQMRQNPQSRVGKSRAERERGE